MKEMQIYPQDNIWQVDHLEDGEPDLEVADLFSGYTSLPTPFSCWIKIQDVVYELAMLNPGKKITICPSAIHFVRWLTCDRCGLGINLPVWEKLYYFEDPTDPVFCIGCSIPYGDCAGEERGGSVAGVKPGRAPGGGGPCAGGVLDSNVLLSSLC